MSRHLLDVLAELIDAAEQTDDFVTGVVGLVEGRAGGEVLDGQSWLARRLSGAGARFELGKRSVVEGMGASYGPDQLRKASLEAARMAPLIDELRATGAVHELMSRLDDLDLGSMSVELGTLAPRDARGIQQRLNRALAAMRETRTRLLLSR